MQQTFANYGSAVAVTPSDTAPVNCRAIYIGGAGDVAIKTTANAAAVTFTAPFVIGGAGSILPIMIDGGRIMATGTTATNIVLLS